METVNRTQDGSAGYTISQRCHERLEDVSGLCARLVHFMPVPAIPVVMYFCRNRKTMVTGSRLRKVIAKI